MLVDDKAVVGLDTGPLEELGIVIESDPDPDKFRFKPLAVRIDDGGDVAVIVGFEVVDATLEDGLNTEVP